MSRSDALSTGLFDRARFDPAKGCEATALKPRKQFKNVEVRTNKAGTIRSFRIVGPGPKTLYGIEVGTHYANLVESYADALEGPNEIGPNRTAAFVAKNGGWIGFRFDEPLEDFDVEDAVTFIEVTKGARPRLNPNC